MKQGETTMASCRDFPDLDPVSREELQARLFQSCRDGHKDVVESLLSKGASLDVRDGHGRSPLVLSCRSGHNDVVALVLDQGVDVRGRDGTEALVEACKNGHWKVVETLAMRGVDVNGKDLDGTTGLTYVWNEGGIKLVEPFEKQASVGVNKYEAESKGTTALMWACVNGHYKVVEILIEHGCNVDDKDDKGVTALMWASMNGRDKVVEVLVKCVSSVDETDSTSMTALMLACSLGHDKVVEDLIKHQSDVTKRDDAGNTALMWACMNGYDRLVGVLVDRLSELNESVDEDCSSLMCACENGHENVVEVLVSLESYLQKRDSHGRTALMMACSRDLVNNLGVEILIQHASDLDERDNEGRTALMWACIKGNEGVVKLLIEGGANADVEDLKGDTPLVLACKGGYVEIIELLMNQGFHTDNDCNDRGTTLLITTCLDGHLKNLSDDGYERITRLIFKHRYEIDRLGSNSRLRRGWLGAMGSLPVMQKHLKHLQALIPSGTILNSEKTTPLGDKIDGCLMFFLEDRTLQTNGEPRHRCKDQNIPYFTEKSLSMTIGFGVLEWSWCAFRYFKFTMLAAIKSGLSPCKIKLQSKSNTCLSPLFVSLLLNDTSLTEIFLERLYYYPDDYRTLLADLDMRGRIENKAVLDKILFQPLSLQTWCYLTVSKAISTSCFPVKRCERVDALPIPDKLKRTLKFK